MLLFGCTLRTPLHSSVLMSSGWVYHIATLTPSLDQQQKAANDPGDPNCCPWLMLPHHASLLWYLQSVLSLLHPPHHCSSPSALTTPLWPPSGHLPHHYSSSSDLAMATHPTGHTKFFTSIQAKKRNKI